MHLPFSPAVGPRDQRFPPPPARSRLAHCTEPVRVQAKAKLRQAVEWPVANKAAFDRMGLTPPR